MKVAFSLYDFVSVDGKSVIAVCRRGLSKRSQGILDSKLNMLAISGMSLPPKLLVGPINKTGHIYKLRINADVMLRPMLCRGPFDMDAEFTLLAGAVEVQGKLLPSPQRAMENRNILLADHERRISHAW